MLSDKLRLYQDLQKRLLVSLQQDREDELRRLDQEMSRVRAEIISLQPQTVADSRIKLHFLLDELCAGFDDMNSARELRGLIAQLFDQQFELES